MILVKWPTVLDYTDKSQRPLVRWIDLANGTMFRMAAFFVHGGCDYPRPGLFIALERAGAFFFAIPERPFSGQYISEKLTIPESDANAMADFINAQFFDDAKQLGEYNANYILECEPVGYGGEWPLMPIVPAIVGVEKKPEPEA